MFSINMNGKLKKRTYFQLKEFETKLNNVKCRDNIAPKRYLPMLLN